MRLPDGFCERMKAMLGEEYDDFLASYEKPRRKGLRVNTSKIAVEDFLRRAPFHLEAIPWTENGFYYSEEDRPSQHPFYAAGLYYLQEPSAMAPAARFPLNAGDRVLDLCAAPGGKATELASRLWDLDGGLLVANEIHPARAKALLHNLETNGTDNYCVLNETPERLADAFPLFFDKILVDAPCSGEGMFRKEEAALTLWSEERIRECADRQETILEAAYAMLRPGGMLLYSTCTFAPEENEMQIDGLLRRHTDLRVVEIPAGKEQSYGMSEGLPVKALDGQRPERIPTSRGRFPDEEETSAGWLPDEPRYGVRIWPHKAEGEGHFLALLKKEDASDGPTLEEAGMKVHSRERGPKRGMKKTSGKPGMNALTKEQKTLLRQFLSAIVLNTATVEHWIEHARVWQERAYLPVIESERTTGLHVIRNGLFLGEWKKNRFEPSQSLAMYLKKEQASRALFFSAEDEQLVAYLRGEMIRAEVEDGWILICVDHFPVGWGKVSKGTIKNHYPPGWRKQE